MPFKEKYDFVFLPLFYKMPLATQFRNPQTLRNLVIFNILASS